MTKWQLLSLLTQQGSDAVRLPGQLGTGSVLAVERESGSGATFNVRVRRTTGRVETLFVRTVD